jgi:hypothetical protein
MSTSPPVLRLEDLGGALEPECAAEKFFRPPSRCVAVAPLVSSARTTALPGNCAALEMARGTVTMARQLALVAQNALRNGDLWRVGAALRHLQDATSARLARGPTRGAEAR